jgi:mono/diheme cytochrome c family protein
MRAIATLVVLVLVSVSAAESASGSEGKALYDALCQTCHGTLGDGDGVGIPEGMLRPRPFRVAVFKFDADADWQKGTDADLALVIRNGPAVYGGSAFMPPWPTLEDAQIVDLVAHIRKLQQSVRAQGELSAQGG